MNRYTVTNSVDFSDLGYNARKSDVERWKKAIAYVCENAEAVIEYETITLRDSVRVEIAIEADDEADAKQIAKDLDVMAWDDGKMAPWSKRSKSRWTHTIVERGNGFPSVGNFVLTDYDNGRAARVLEVSPIFTDRPQWGNYIFARLSADRAAGPRMWNDPPFGVVAEPIR